MGAGWRESDSVGGYCAAIRTLCVLTQATLCLWSLRSGSAASSRGSQADVSSVAELVRLLNSTCAPVSLGPVHTRAFLHTLKGVERERAAAQVAAAEAVLNDVSVAVRYVSTHPLVRTDQLGVLNELALLREKVMGRDRAAAGNVVLSAALSMFHSSLALGLLEQADASDLNALCTDLEKARIRYTTDMITDILRQELGFVAGVNCRTVHDLLAHMIQERHGQTEGTEPQVTLDHRTQMLTMLLFRKGGPKSFHSQLGRIDGLTFSWDILTALRLQALSRLGAYCAKRLKETGSKDKVTVLENVFRAHFDEADQRTLIGRPGDENEFLRELLGARTAVQGLVRTGHLRALRLLQHRLSGGQKKQ